jgi:DNA polymerase-3 subunit alpha
VRSLVTKKGDTMAILSVEDITGTISAVLFPRTWDKFRDLVEPDIVLVLNGKADTSRGDVQIIVDTVSQDFEVVQPVEELPKLESLRLSWMDDERAESGDERVTSPYDEETGELVSDRTSEIEPEPVSEAIMPATAGASIPTALPIEPAPAPAVSVSPADPGSGTDMEVPGWLDAELDQGWVPDAPRSSAPHADGPPPASAARPRDLREALTSTEQPTVRRPRRPTPAPVAPSAPRRLLKLFLWRSGDSTADRRKMRRLHGFVTEYPGTDQFCFIVQDGERRVRIDYKQYPIQIHDDMLDTLRQELGAENVVVEELDL